MGLNIAPIRGIRVLKKFNLRIHTCDRYSLALMVNRFLFAHP